ncbi:hypothetical protein Gotur_023490 [Gossypium turneri]
MITTTFADSASVKHGRLAFIGARLVQSFSCHETVKLDEEAQMACDVWNTATSLFVAVISMNLSCLRHDLHSLKKCSLAYKECVAKIQNTSALIEASGSWISEVEKVEMVLAGLPPEFDAILTLASFSSEPLPLQRLIDRCFFRYNREYDSPSSVVRTSNLADRHGPGVSFPFDGTLIYKAMWREAKECLYVGPDVGDGDSKGVFWYCNKF